MIVKIEWQEHDRKYTIGLLTFLKKMKIDVTEKDIEKVVKELLSEDALQSK